MWRYFKDTLAQASDTRITFLGASLADIPVVIDSDLTGGQWQIREDGEVTASGDIAPPPEGMLVGYAPPVGWYAYDPESAVPVTIQPLGMTSQPPGKWR